MRSIGFDGEPMWEDGRQEISHTMTRAQALAVARERLGLDPKQLDEADACMSTEIAGCSVHGSPASKSIDMERDTVLQAQALLREDIERLTRERDEARQAAAQLWYGGEHGIDQTEVCEWYPWAVPLLDEHARKWTEKRLASRRELRGQRDEARRLARWFYGGLSREARHAAGDIGAWPWLDVDGNVTERPLGEGAP